MVDAAREVLDELIAWYRLRAQDTNESREALASVLYQAEEWDDAQQLYEELAAERTESTESTTYLSALSALGKLAARRSDREEALRISERLRAVELPHLEERAALERARIAALLGEREQAMTLLQHAIDKVVNWGYGVWLHRDMDFESLRDYPPFLELMRPKG